MQLANASGFYVEDDVSIDIQFVVEATAEGARAGENINKWLQKEEFKTRRFN